jgi:hypothetical protein
LHRTAREGLEALAKKTYQAWVLLFGVALGIAGCGAKSGLDAYGPPAQLSDDAGRPPPPLDAAPTEDAFDAFTPDAPDGSLACAYLPPSRPFPLTGCGDLGPRIQDTAPTRLYRELPCDVQEDAFPCGATPLSYADCEAYCLSDSFDLLSLNGSLILSCSVWIYAKGAHELECDTAYSG